MAVWASSAVLEKFQTKLVVTYFSSILDASAILAASTIFIFDCAIARGAPVFGADRNGLPYAVETFVESHVTSSQAVLMQNGVH